MAASLFSFDNIKSALVGVFLIGAPWTRLEYKMDQMNTATQVIIEKYVISNDKDKEIFLMKIQSVQSQLDVNTVTIKSITEFIKPEEVKPKNYR